MTTVGDPQPPTTIPLSTDSATPVAAPRSTPARPHRESRYLTGSWLLVPAALTAMLAVAAWITFGPSVFAVTCVAVTGPVVAAVWTDLWIRELPPRLTNTALAATTAGLAVAGLADPGSSVRALSAGAVAFVVLTLLGWLGRLFSYGDVFLATPLVMLVGFHSGAAILGLVQLTVLAALPGTVWAMLRARSHRVQPPLGPALLVAAVIVLAQV
ncbi:hypothetical protein [Nocardia sp. IFM 10818]